MKANLMFGLQIQRSGNVEFPEYQKYMDILMRIILSPVTFSHRLTEEEWRHFFTFMDILYGNALKEWLSKYNHLSEQEIALCYFCYIGIRHNNQAVFFGLSPQSLSKRKQRLKNKLAIPQSMSLKDAIIKSQPHLSI